ncbi:MAG: ParB/RepB/Spo0J family partition protein [Dysosmobacter sp.]
MAGKKGPSIFSTLQKTTENASAVNGELTRQLPVASLVDNPMNRFSMAEDDEFLSTMRSVEQDGFLEDIVVTPDGENTWRIISGHRRVMAARKLGKTAVPCKVRRYPDKLSELRALMGANVHRRSLSPFDMARQLETLREVLSESGQLPEGTKEQAELMAAQSDLSRATVERYLDLLNLDETMTGWAERGEMTMTDAYEMARRKNVHLQAAVEEYVAHNNANGDFPALSTGPSPGQRPPSCPRLRPSPPLPPIPCGRWIPLAGPSGAPPPSSRHWISPPTWTAPPPGRSWTPALPIWRSCGERWRP